MNTLALSTQEELVEIEAVIDTDVAGLNYPPRIMSGIQPTANVHLGHYFGALKHHIDLHHQYPGECFFMIADYHGMTRGINPIKIRQDVLEIATVYLALGLDPNKAILYRQSEVPRITELAWILSCITPLNRLHGNPSFKHAVERSENAGRHIEAHGTAMLTYPVLMAADVLSLRSTIVPLGHDQRPNFEIVRHIAKLFNSYFAPDFFPIPMPLHLQTHVVPGTDGNKMLTESDNHIPIFARYDQLRSKVRKIKTSSASAEAPKDPDKCTIFKLHSLVATREQNEALRARYELRGSGAIPYDEAKRQLLLEIQEYFSRYEERYHSWKREPDTVLDVLRSGFTAARRETEATLDRIANLVGISY